MMLEDDLIALFYAYTGVLKQRLTCKYRNQLFLSGICNDAESNRMEAIFESRVYRQQLPLDLFCRLVRTLTLHYLETLCPRAIMISRKINKPTKPEHFRRRRIIIQSLLEDFQEN